MLTNTQRDEILDTVLNRPETILQDLGTEKAMDLLRELSEDPHVAARLRECKLVKLIESGRKYVLGEIIQEGINHD